MHLQVMLAVAIGSLGRRGGPVPLQQQVVVGDGAADHVRNFLSNLSCL